MANLNTLLERVQEVCPLPQTAHRIMELSSRPDANIREVTAALAADPALAVETLRIANSPVYGRMRTISDLQTAVMMIGLNEVHQLASAMAMLAAFRTEDELSLKFHDWSVVSASIAGALAKRLGSVRSGTAFLCGLLCEIGAMACLAVDTQGYFDLWSVSSSPEDRRLREVERYGASSREIGSKLLERNSLPQQVADAIAAEPKHPEANVDPLVSVTIFARAAVPALLRVADLEQREALELELFQEAEAAGLKPSFFQDLVEVCIQAGAEAWQALKRTR